MRNNKALRRIPKGVTYGYMKTSLENKYDQDSFDKVFLMIIPNSITMITNINSIISLSLFDLSYIYIIKNFQSFFNKKLYIISV